MHLAAMVLALLALRAVPPAAPQPALQMRGTVNSFPFYLGNPIYGNMWAGNAATDTRTDWWWYDRAQWTRQFTEMEARKLNTYVLLHPHPYPALVDLPDYPQARCLPPEALARSREMLRWILAEGKRHGVRIYFLTWNIWTPPGLAQARKEPQDGQDTPEVRRYTRQAVAALFRDFPDLAGLATMAAETPPGCVGFVEEAICGGLRDSGANPELIFWSWCSYPEDSLRIKRAYPRTRFLHYLQYEQFFRKQADPRIGRFSKATGNTPMVALGGPKSGLGYLFWFDPSWIRDVVHDLRRQAGTGLLWETYIEDPWLSQEAFARFAADRSLAYNPAQWARIVGERYGCPSAGADLLEAMRSSSAVVPQLITLVHSQTDHYMPQLGMPLAYYVEMPTLSSYIFENCQTLDKRGYLRPNMGLCWPNPDWGERVVSIRDFAAGHVPKGATTPAMIANRIAGAAARCRVAVARVRARIAKPGEYLATTLQRLDLNAALGEHYAAKIQAGIAWERFRRGAATGPECVRQLEQSVKAWEGVSAIASRLFPGEVGFWRSEIAAPPPWTQMQLWEGYASVKGHWRNHLQPFRRELEMVRREVTRRPADSTLPLWDSLLAAPEEQLVPLFSDRFETLRTDVWAMGPSGRLSATAAEAIEGRHSLVLDSRGLAGEWHESARWKPGAVRLERGRKYQVTFRYRVLAAGKEYPNPFAVAARSREGGVPADIGTARTWSGATGAVGTRTVVLEPTAYADYELFFSLHGQAAIAIDDLRVDEVKAK